MATHLFFTVAALTVLTTACAGGTATPPTTTAVPATVATHVELSPTAADGSTTGEATLDAVLVAVANQQPDLLMALLGATNVPCDNEFSILPDCLGAPEGSHVPSVWSFQCQDGWVPVTRVAASPSTVLIGRYRLYAVTRGGPLVGRGSVVIPVDRWVLFDALGPGMPAGMAIAVANGHVVAFGNSCGDLAAFRLRYTYLASGFVVPPQTP